MASILIPDFRNGYVGSDRYRERKRPVSTTVSRGFELNRPVYHAMLQHLQAVWPLEGCGLLAGPGATAATYYPIRNILQSPTAFRMDPHDQARTMSLIDQRGHHVLGIVHSHPQTPAYPSASDIASSFYPDAVYLIVSLLDRDRPVARAFRLVDASVHEMPLNIT